MTSPRTITLTTTVESPVGPLTLTSNEGRLTGLHMAGQAHSPTDRTGWTKDAFATSPHSCPPTSPVSSRSSRWTWT